MLTGLYGVVVFTVAGALFLAFYLLFQYCLKQYILRLTPELALLSSEKERYEVSASVQQELNEDAEASGRLIPVLEYLALVGIVCGVFWAVQRFHLPGWSIPIALFLLPFLGLAQFVLQKRKIQLLVRRVMNNRGFLICMNCGYDLRGQAEPRCPECGRLLSHMLLNRPAAGSQELRANGPDRATAHDTGATSAGANTAHLSRPACDHPTGPIRRMRIRYAVFRMIVVVLLAIGLALLAFTPLYLTARGVLSPRMMLATFALIGFGIYVAIWCASRRRR